MPNWCSGCMTIVPSGDNVFLAEEFMQWIRDNEDNTEGVMPEFVKPVTDSYIFNIYNADEYTFQFEAKWAVPIMSMRQIARKYKFSFILEYEETGSQDYGEFKFDFESDTMLDKCVPSKIWPDDNEEETGLSYFDELARILEEQEFENFPL